MTVAQIQLLQVAKRQLDLPDWAYRDILRKHGGLNVDRPSSKDLDNAGFEQVMAFLEGEGFRNIGRPETYWRDKVGNRGRFADSRQVHRIREAAALVPRYPLPAMCLHVSGDRVRDEARLTPREAHNLIELYKAAAGREPAKSEQRNAQPGFW